MNEKRFRNKTAVVVGGAGGIGSAIVQRLAREGACVAVGDMDMDALDRMKAGLGERILCVRTDVTCSEDQQRLISEAVDTFGGLDAAFNVAGGSRMGLIDEGPEEDWLWTIDLCLKGTYLGMKYQIRAMKRFGGGSIVNISSINAITPMWGDSAYNASKKGVLSLTETAMLENTKYGIRCNAIIPGQIDTKMTRGWRAVPQINEEYERRIPMHRPGTPEEVAAAALFLASDEASYITGTSILVDGGRVAASYPNIAPYLEEHPELWQV